jgi:hypothetical protein
MDLNNQAPYIEIDTPAFRAVAKSFLSLPYPVVLAAMTSMQSTDAVQQVSGVVKALEIALEPKDFVRLQTLTVDQLIAVIQDWVEPISGIGV